jgi:hypothetical protein
LINDNPKVVRCLATTRCLPVSVVRSSFGAQDCVVL